MSLARQFSSFVVVGGISTALHYLVLAGMVELLGTEPTLATTAGFIAGAVVNYALNRTVTFRSTRSHGSAVPRFLAAATSGMVLNALLVAVGVHLAGLHYLPAQVISTVVVLFWNFTINKYWTFSRPIPCPPQSKE